MKKLRIAQIFSSDATQPGGVKTHIYFLTKALEARGHKITIFGCGRPSDFRFSSYQSVGSAVQIPTPNGNWASITFANKNMTKLVRRLNNQEFDICHIHEPYTPFTNWQIMQQVTKLPIVTTFHSGWDEKSAANLLNPILPLFQHLFSAKISAAIFVSKIAKKDGGSFANQMLSKVSFQMPLIILYTTR